MQLVPNLKFLIGFLFLFGIFYYNPVFASVEIIASSTAFATATEVATAVDCTNANLAILFWNDNNGGATAYRATYDGNDMTGGGGGSIYGNHFWAYLKNPDSGSHDFAITSDIVRNIHMTGICLSGVDISEIPVSASSTASRSGGLFQNNLTATLNDFILDNAFTVSTGIFTGFGNNQIIKTSFYDGLGNGSTIGTIKIATSTGAVSMIETANGADAGSALAIVLKTASAGGSSQSGSTSITPEQDFYDYKSLSLILLIFLLSIYATIKLIY